MDPKQLQGAVDVLGRGIRDLTRNLKPRIVRDATRAQLSGALGMLVAAANLAATPEKMAPDVPVGPQQGGGSDGGDGGGTADP